MNNKTKMCQMEINKTYVFKIGAMTLFLKYVSNSNIFSSTSLINCRVQRCLYFFVLLTMKLIISNLPQIYYLKDH